MTDGAAKSLPAKCLTVFAVAGLTGFGLCTAGVVVGDDRLGWLIPLGAGCFWVSLLGVIVSAVWLEPVMKFMRVV
jgi:hypothetical protein